VPTACVHGEGRYRIDILCLGDGDSALCLSRGLVDDTDRAAQVCDEEAPRLLIDYHAEGVRDGREREGAQRGAVAGIQDGNRRITAVSHVDAVCALIDGEGAGLVTDRHGLHMPAGNCIEDPDMSMCICRVREEHERTPNPRINTYSVGHVPCHKLRKDEGSVDRSQGNCPNGCAGQAEGDRRHDQEGPSAAPCPSHSPHPYVAHRYGYRWRDRGFHGFNIAPLPTHVEHGGCSILAP